MENEPVKCDHDAPFIGIGQSVVNLGGGMLVVTSTACSKCGRNFQVEVTQIPFKIEKEDKADIMLPKPPTLRR